jgi:sec-independent protein translocase protein TatA
VQLGPAEILVVLLIALLVFGPNRLPEIGRQVGKGVREFRKFQQTIKGDFDEVFTDDASGHAEPAPSLPPRELEPGTPSVDSVVPATDDGTAHTEAGTPAAPVTGTSESSEPRPEPPPMSTEPPA